jgi:hypothetical protein
VKTSNLTKTAFLALISSFGALAFSVPANAIELEQVSARAGTLGVGGEIGFEILPTLVVRGIAQKYDYNRTDKVDQISYDSTLKLGSAGVQVDFHPPIIPLYLTAGVYSNQNEVESIATPSGGSYTIGGTTYTAAQVGTLTANAKFKPTALYGGAGLEFQLGPVGIVAEAGVFYQDTPEVSMVATGAIASDATFKQKLADETNKLIDDFDGSKYYPALTIMGRWKF